MLEKILELLNSDTFYGKSELIEIAKGKYKLHDNISGVREQNKRAKQWQLRKK